MLSVCVFVCQDLPFVLGSSAKTSASTLYQHARLSRELPLIFVYLGAPWGFGTASNLC